MLPSCCSLCDDDLVVWTNDHDACVVCLHETCRWCGRRACPCRDAPLTSRWTLELELDQLCRHPWVARHFPVVSLMPQWYAVPWDQLARLHHARRWLGAWHATPRNDPWARANATQHCVRLLRGVCARLRPNQRTVTWLLLSITHENFAACERLVPLVCAFLVGVVY